MRYFTVLVCLAFGISHAIAQKNSSAMNDDFASYRPQYTFEREQFAGTNTGEVKRMMLPLDTTSQKRDFTAYLNKILDEIPVVATLAKIVEKKKFEGYRIQIYRGRSREEASRARNKSYEMFPNLTPYLEYRAPTYRVNVGDFLEPSEYLPYLKKFKRVFPLALPSPAIITIIVDRREDPQEEKK